MYPLKRDTAHMFHHEKGVRYDTGDDVLRSWACEFPFEGEQLSLKLIASYRDLRHPVALRLLPTHSLTPTIYYKYTPTALFDPRLDERSQLIMNPRTTSYIMTSQGTVSPAEKRLPEYTYDSSSPKSRKPCTPYVGQGRCRAVWTRRQDSPDFGDGPSQASADSEPFTCKSWLLTKDFVPAQPGKELHLPLDYGNATIEVSQGGPLGRARFRLLPDDPASTGDPSPTHEDSMKLRSIILMDMYRVGDEIKTIDENGMETTTCIFECDLYEYTTPGDYPWEAMDLWGPSEGESGNVNEGSVCDGAGATSRRTRLPWPWGGPGLIYSW